MTKNLSNSKKFDGSTRQKWTNCMCKLFIANCSLKYGCVLKRNYWSLKNKNIYLIINEIRAGF